MSNSLITPRTLKGFRDYLPDAMIPREQLMETAKSVYRSYGFVPIETPVLELAEILCGKGSEETDRQMFRFLDGGKRDVGMRFDLTVPLARFVAQHSNELGMPFKRYHLGNVWRGEKPQVGRYREFMQCDFDTIGTTSMASDIETALVINDLMRAIGFEKFTIHVNNRKVLNGLLDKFGLLESSVAVLRAIDKLPKIGPEKVATELQANTSADDQQIKSILGLAELNGDNQSILTQLDAMATGSELAEEGVGQLRQLVQATQAVGITDSHLNLDVSIARGLDYYTGTIFETFLGDLPSIGSVCSGGRYDNLAELFTKQQLPGIGASLGLDRLLAAMQQLEMIPPVRTTAEVMIVQFDESYLNRYLQIAANLRAAGIRVEVFPAAKKLKQQLKYAERRGFPVVIVAGSDELDKDQVQVKLMEARETKNEVSLANKSAELIQLINESLSS